MVSGWNLCMAFVPVHMTLCNWFKVFCWTLKKLNLKPKKKWLMKKKISIACHTLLASHFRTIHELNNYVYFFSGSSGGPNEKRLLSFLLDKYNPLERPVSNESEPVVVAFGLTLMQIIDVVRPFISSFISLLLSHGDSSASHPWNCCDLFNKLTSPIIHHLIFQLTRANIYHNLIIEILCNSNLLSLLSSKKIDWMFTTWKLLWIKILENTMINLETSHKMLCIKQ